MSWPKPSISLDEGQIARRVQRPELGSVRISDKTVMVKPNHAEKMVLTILTEMLIAMIGWSTGELRSILWIVRERQCLAGTKNWCVENGAMSAGTKVAGLKWIVSLKV
jgi:hypothetical protein